jgi:hypothetical protein
MWKCIVKCTNKWIWIYKLYEWYQFAHEWVHEFLGLETVWKRGANGVFKKFKFVFAKI